ncbi:MAG: cytochrome c [Verrucomicrobiota bacterium]
MRYVYLTFFLAVIATVSILGFRGDKSTRPPIEVFPDMDRMPKYHPQGKSEFFSDGRADRMPVENTVPRGAYFEDEYKQTGRLGADFGMGIPVALNNELMAKGEERYNIYCAVCHGLAGDGKGRTADYGMVAIADLTLSPYMAPAMTDGQVYEIIVKGSRSGRMFGYADKLSVEERWAVVAYVRALQRAANGTANDLTPAKREELGL